MTRRTWLWLAISAALAVLFVQCANGTRIQTLQRPSPARMHNPPEGTSSVATEPVAVPGLPFADGQHTVGQPKVLGNLAVFPVYAYVQEALGEFTTLELAVEKGAAVVRERGSEPQPPVPTKTRTAQNGSQPRGGAAPQQLQVQVHNQNDIPQQANGYGGGATVNQLVIENRGDLPILVLAGSVVKGGRQDRQISQDFVVGPHEVAGVDAYCVEHGRWTPHRDGEDTRGRFSATKTLALGEVRKAGQYEQNQGRVWAKVGEVNQVHKKQASTGTLMATLDDQALMARRAAMTRDLLGQLSQVQAPASAVGIAYAVDGKVRGVRWFFNHDLFAKYAEILVNTAALDALTAQAAAGAPGSEPKPTTAPQPADVIAFVADVDNGKVETRDTSAQNVNEVRDGAQGYGSTATLKAGAGGKASTKTVTKDYLAK